MKIVAMSDLHGILPEVPECDLLLLGGDLCPLKNHQVEYQADWLNTTFRTWLEQVPARKIVGVAGNHDFVFERAGGLVPDDLPWTYLQDSGTNWEGLRIWGSPWQPKLVGWAFGLEEEELAARWELIPEGTDIVVLHGPPYGFGDGIPEEEGVRRVGSPSLQQRLERLQARLVIFGHIHEGRGEWHQGRTRLANVTILDESYQQVHAPWECEWSE